MKLPSVVPVGLGVLILIAGCARQSQPPTRVDLQDSRQRLSYSIGADLGGTMKRQGIDVEPQALAAGIADALEGNLALSEAEMKEALGQFRQELMEKAHAKANVSSQVTSEQAEANRKQGEAFLAANAAKEGVITTASGLQYKVLKSGTGKTPKATDKVKVHYHGTLVDGTTFDSSIERGQPVTFAVNQVIAGWTEALQLMKEGDKWQLFIRPDLAYGKGGAGGKIGPNATLIFEVELLAVE